MDKALIEKAFEKWLDDYKSRSRCTHLDAFAGGATWQREQLEAEIIELKTKLNAIYDKDNEAQTKLNDAIDIIEKIKTEMPTAYQDYDGVCQATEHLCADFLAKLDLLEKGIK